MPQANGDGKTYQLGIAAGMSIGLSGQQVSWQQPNKAIQLKAGANTLSIHRRNSQLKQCNITLNGDVLRISSSEACVGVVNNGNVIYFLCF